MAKIEIYQGYNDEWYWRLRAGNGQTVCDGAEGYSTKSNVKRAARRIGGSVLLSKIIEVKARHGRGVKND